jgi:hypothetical protein
MARKDLIQCHSDAIILDADLTLFECSTNKLLINSSLQCFNEVREFKMVYKEDSLIKDIVRP